MAQIPLTGGDGSTGQTGLSARQAINANDAELYGYTAEEFDREWTPTMLFDKPLVVYAPTILADDVNFGLEGTGHLVDRASLSIQNISTDGSYAFNFSAGFSFTYGISNGQVLESGTYEFYFLYINGGVRVSVPGVTAQDSSLIPLAAPANFTAVADGEDTIDLEWDDVAGEVSYLIQFSLDGATGWTTLSTPAAGVTTASQTGLTAGDVRYYRIKAIGDGVINSDSAYTPVSGVTDNPIGAAPEFTFSPASGVTTATVNETVVINSDIPIRNTNGTALDNSNIAAVLTVKQTNSGGANIAFTATIDSGKTVITIRPVTSFGITQLVYVAINNVESVSSSDEITVAVSSTFTTTEFTDFNGTSNAIIGGDILDTLFTVNDAHFKIGITLNGPSLTGTHMFITKYALTSNQRSFYFYSSDTSIRFGWSHSGTGSTRVVSWANALSSGEHVYELEYNGAIDTNNGLDRCILKIDGVVAGSKTIDITYPPATIDIAQIFNGTAQLAFGAGVNASGIVDTSSWYYIGEAKDFLVLDGASTEIVNVPDLKAGTDVSGNGHDMTWLS